MGLLFGTASAPQRRRLSVEEAVAEALRLSGGNRSQAAKRLGISRPTLLARIEKYGLRTDTIVEAT